MKACHRFGAHLFFLAVYLLVALSQTQAQERRALLLYKGSEEGVSASRVATNIEPILKSLGIQSDYHDVDEGLPTQVDAELIVSWYSTPKIADPEEYVDWMARQISEGKKVVILGNFGAHTKDGESWMTNESLNRFFYPFGLSYGAAYTGDAQVLKVTKQSDPAKAPSPLNHYLLFSSVNPENRVFLEVDRTDLANARSALVVQTPFGAMAQEGFVNHLDLKAFISNAVAAEAKTAAAKKKLLGLYKSSEGVDSRSNFLARFVAPTLFDLGYGIDYYDIEQGLPEKDKMSQYSGVISWYTTPELGKAGDYIIWLAQQLEADRRVVILGNFGAFAEDISSSAGEVRRYLQSPEYNKFFYPFGLEFRGAWTPEKKSVRVSQRDEQVMTWLEPNHIGHYYWIRSVHPDNKKYLTVTREDLQDGESAVVVATPNGGLALESYVLSTDPATQQPRMHIDLNKFLKSALTLEGSSRVAELKPNLEDLKPKKPLPILPKPIWGGNGQYPSDVTPVKRKILAFYQSSAGETSTQNRTFLAAQTILEHLGLLVQYHDLDSPTLPSLEDMEDFRGILFWIASDAIPNAREFDAWLIANVQNGRKLVLLGDYHMREKDNLSLINPQGLYAALGMHYDPVGNAPLVVNAKGINAFTRVAPRNPKVVYQRPGAMDFERELQWADKDLKNNWHIINSAWPDSEIDLTVTQAGTPSDVVVTTRTGGVAVGPFAVYAKGTERKKRAEISAQQNNNKAQAEDEGGDPWRIDPFRFFKKAYALEGLPKPDFTTLNGSRIYYSHIDGDAYGGISRIDSSSLNGEMMYKRVLKDLPLPVTVSYVTRDIERLLDDRYSRELTVAQEIFKLSNVEPASHTYSHPFDWQLGDLSIDTSAQEAYKLIRKDIDLERELVHSLEFIDKLCPPDKRCEILLWSGRCNPGPEAIELVRQKGLPNMNGSESTFDEKFPYLAGLLPVFGDVDGEAQYHVSAAGDFYYTSSWTQNYDGMKNLVDYFNRTESPRRLRCLNVYYHFYLAEREPGIQGLKLAYDDVLRREPAPVFASEYTSILRDYLETKVGLDKQNNYWISNSGYANTVRFDNETRFPDLSKSAGVLGFNRTNDALYLHLDGSGEARIALTDAAPTTPYVDRFTHRIKDWSAQGDSISFLAEGQGPASLSINNLMPSTTYRIEVNSKEFSIQTDSEGKFLWKGRFDGYRTSHPVRIRKVMP